MNGHPTVPLLPAAFALAEAGGCTGEQLLRAYVVGFEVEARLGQALGRPHYERGWHATSTLGVFGATAASGVLLGLDAGALRRAFGIAVSRASGTRANFGTDTKPLHAGLAARAGLEAAQLAQRGVTAREDALEMDMGLADLYGGRVPFELPSLDDGFALERPGVELKPYPSCRFTHRAIDAVLSLREKHARPRAARDRVRERSARVEDPDLPRAAHGARGEVLAPILCRGRVARRLAGPRHVLGRARDRPGRAGVAAARARARVALAPTSRSSSCSPTARARARRCASRAAIRRTRSATSSASRR